jgi:TolB-like protein/Flp pilus assembly protein TadD
VSLFDELRRRNVLRAAVLYIGAVWALAQGISQLSPAVGLPDMAARWFLIAAAIGFPFWIAFAWFYEWTPQGLKRESEIAADASIVRSTGRKMDRAIIAVLTVAVVLLVTDRFVAHGGAGKAATSEKSIAVLPLVNESGDKDQQYFSDGLSEDLINALSQFAGLKVISRNSSFQFRDSRDDSRTIGAKLGVAHLLEGSVRRVGDTVRISAELVNAADSSMLWSQRYDRPYTDLFALQDDITRQVAEALKTKLLEGTVAAAQSDRPPSGNLEAYNAYMQGIFVARRNTDAGMREAIGHYEEAIRLDPRYALAYAGLGRAAMALPTVFSVTDRNERDALIAKARAAVATALALQPDLGRAHQSRAFMLQVVDLDLVAAETEYRRAAELAPQDAGNVFSLGIVNASFGRLAEAATFGRQAVVLDPLSSINYVYLARTLRALGRYDEAESALRKALEINPAGAQTYCELAILQILRGNAAAAIDLAQRETDPFWRAFALTLAHFAHGDQADAEAGLKELIDKYADSGAFQIAQVYALRKQPDKMFEWLDHALAVHDPGAPTLRYAAFVMDYSADPRFAAFCSKIGLPAATDAKAIR